MSIYNDVFLIDQQLNELYEQLHAEDKTEDERTKILEQAKEYCLNTGLEKLCKIRQNKKAEIESLKEEEKRLAAKRKSLEGSQEWLENYIASIFQMSGEKKATYGSFTLSFRKSVKCIIDENIFNDERFQTIREVKDIDKMAVKSALTAGEEIVGASLEENQNLQIK